MKLLPLLLAASLAANAVLLGFILFGRSNTRISFHVNTPPHRPDPATAERARIVALQAALASGDPAALAAAGVSPETIRALQIGRAFDSFQAQMRKARPVSPRNQYWRPSARSADPAVGREQRLAANKAEHDFSEAVRLAYGELPEGLFPHLDTRYAFLPPAKREQLHRIERDYAELQAQLDPIDGIRLPADLEKLTLLQREQERDIAAALTPAEREQLDLRSSNSAYSVRERFGEVLQTEEEYKKIYALKKAFDDRFSAPNSNATEQQWREADQKLSEDIRAALSPEQLATLQRNNDRDRTAATAIARRFSLPTTAVDAVLATRDLYASQSLQINANHALSAEERRTQLQALVAKSQAALQATLGDGAQHYIQRAPWIRMLREGSAFSTNPKDAPSAQIALTSSVFQVPPPISPPTPPRPPAQSPGGG